MNALLAKIVAIQEKLQEEMVPIGLPSEVPCAICRNPATNCIPGYPLRCDEHRSVPMPAYAPRKLSASTEEVVAMLRSIPSPIYSDVEGRSTRVLNEEDLSYLQEHSNGSVLIRCQPTAIFLRFGNSGFFVSF